MDRVTEALWADPNVLRTSGCASPDGRVHAVTQWTTSGTRAVILEVEGSHIKPRGTVTAALWRADVAVQIEFGIVLLSAHPVGLWVRAPRRPAILHLRLSDGRLRRIARRHTMVFPFPTREGTIGLRTLAEPPWWQLVGGWLNGVEWFDAGGQRVQVFDLARLRDADFPLPAEQVPDIAAADGLEPGTAILWDPIRQGFLEVGPDTLRLRSTRPIRELAVWRERRELGAVTHDNLVWRIELMRVGEGVRSKVLAMERGTGIRWAVDGAYLMWRQREEDNRMGLRLFWRDAGRIRRVSLDADIAHAAPAPQGNILAVGDSEASLLSPEGDCLAAAPLDELRRQAGWHAKV